MKKITTIALLALIIVSCNKEEYDLTIEMKIDYLNDQNSAIGYNVEYKGENGELFLLENIPNDTTIRVSWKQETERSQYVSVEPEDRMTSNVAMIDIKVYKNNEVMTNVTGWFGYLNGNY